MLKSSEIVLQVVTWFWFGRYLALANLGYFGVNLLCFLIPRFLPRAFEQYFRERDEILAKSQEDKPVQVPRSKPSNHKSDWSSFLFWRCNV